MSELTNFIWRLRRFRIVRSDANLLTPKCVVRQYKRREKPNMKRNIVASLVISDLNATKEGDLLRAEERSGYRSCEAIAQIAGEHMKRRITKRALLNNRSLNRRCVDCKQPGVHIRATRKRLFGI